MPFANDGPNKDVFQEIVVYGKTSTAENIEVTFVRNGTKATVAVEDIIYKEPVLRTSSFVQMADVDITRLRGKITRTWLKGDQFIQRVAWEPWNMDTTKNYDKEDLEQEHLIASVYIPLFLVGEILDHQGEYTVIKGNILLSYRIAYNQLFCVFEDKKIMPIHQKDVWRPGTHRGSEWVEKTGDTYIGQSVKLDPSIGETILSQTFTTDEYIDAHAWDLGARNWVATGEDIRTIGGGGRAYELPKYGIGAQAAAGYSTLDTTRETGDMKTIRQHADDVNPPVVPQGQRFKLSITDDPDAVDPNIADFPTDDWAGQGGGAFDYRLLEDNPWYESNPSGMVYHSGRAPDAGGVELQPMGQSGAANAGDLADFDWEASNTGFATDYDAGADVELTEILQPPTPGATETVATMRAGPLNPSKATIPKMKSGGRFNIAEFMKDFDAAPKTPGLFDYKSMDKTPGLAPSGYKPFAPIAELDQRIARPTAQRYTGRVYEPEAAPAPGEAAPPPEIELTDMSTFPEREGGRPLSSWDRAAADPDTMGAIQEESEAFMREGEGLSTRAFNVVENFLELDEEGMATLAELGEMAPGAIGIALYAGSMVYKWVKMAEYHEEMRQLAKDRLKYSWLNEGVWVYIHIQDDIPMFKWWKGRVTKVNIKDEGDNFMLESWNVDVYLNAGVTKPLIIKDGTNIMKQRWGIPKNSRQYKYMYNAESLAGLQNDRNFDKYDNPLKTPQAKFTLAQHVTGWAKGSVTRPTTKESSGYIGVAKYSVPWSEWAYWFTNGAGPYMESNLRASVSTGVHEEVDDTISGEGFLSHDAAYETVVATIEESQPKIDAIFNDCWTITFYKIDTVFVTEPNDIYLSHPSRKCRIVIRTRTKQYFFFLQTDFPSELNSLGDIPEGKM